MKNKYIEYMVLLLFLIGICIYDKLYIKYNINSIVVSKLLCSNISTDFQEYKKYNNINYTLSKVKYRDIYNYKHEFTIYKGYMNNIKPGYAVINDIGLVGIITKCYKYVSIVRLITNNKSAISVKINNNYGILKYKDTLYVDDIIGDVSINDLVYTSGFGNIIPNILIGRVNNITYNNINKKIEISPSVDFDSINYLYILGDFND